MARNYLIILPLQRTSKANTIYKRLLKINGLTLVDSFVNNLKVQICKMNKIRKINSKYLHMSKNLTIFAPDL